MNEEKDSFRVIIVGAGPAGLLAAQSLKKVLECLSQAPPRADIFQQNIHCTVFEQDASLDERPRDWNFGIYWAQAPLDECLPADLSRLVESAQVDSLIPAADAFMPMYNGQSGELLKKLSTPYMIRLQRRRFLKLISTGIDIRYGKRLDHIESDGKVATAIFEDGTREVGNLLIGAEGAHSKVRHFLLSPDKSALHMSPFVGSVAITKLPAEAALRFKDIHPRFVLLFHPNGIFGWIGVHEAHDGLKPGEWTFMIMQTWISEHDLPGLKGPKIVEDMKERGRLFAEPFNALFQSMPEDSRSWHSRLSYWPTEAWDNCNGTLTLIGDAAHPMTFHRGQGLNNAVHDVARLARELKNHGTASQSAVASALAAYEQEVWQRGKEAVMSSYHNTACIHNWEMLLESPIFTLGIKPVAVHEDTKPN